MCGIFACVECVGAVAGKTWNLKHPLIERLKRRGPDQLQEANIPCGCLNVHLLGTLLQMRGPATPQPQQNKNGDCLLWNGNVFGGIQIEAHENDTVKVLELLGGQKDPKEILSTLSSINGPWAFVFWQACTSSLWFGRDVFGRRSLLWHLPTTVGDPLVLSSVGLYDPEHMPLGYWLEVPATGLFQLKCEGVEHSFFDLICYPWMDGGICFQEEASICMELSSLKTSLKSSVIKSDSLQIPFPPLNKKLPLPDMRANPLKESCSPGLECDVQDAKKETAIAGSGTDSVAEFHAVAQQLLAILHRAVETRVMRAPPVDVSKKNFESASTPHSHESTEVTAGACKSSTPTPPADISAANGGKVIQGRARVAVLYSGGVDSAVLAALTDRCLDVSEEIDLINVAFEQRTIIKPGPVAGPQQNFDVPDRKSAIETLAELSSRRKWNLIQVNVTLDEVNRLRKEHVSHLIYPLCTVLDDSIGCALWCAAQGVGVIFGDNPDRDKLYKSRARTLLVGIGADEQLAGYSRHRTKFRSSGWKGLIEEVEMDIKRLAKRNLGRDDRCIADHQREGQFPFLDEEVVCYLQQLPMWSKVDLSLPRGIGEKRVLREVAAILGCHTAARLPKRAIQFGSRMAKLSGSSNNREHGSDISDRLLPHPV